MLFYKQYKEKLWIYIFNKKNNYLIFSIIIFIFLSFNKAYSINLCDKLAALEADPRKTSKPVLFEDLDAKKIITNCTNDLEKAKNSENISRFYLQRARGFLKIGSINDAISDLNKSYSCFQDWLLFIKFKNSLSLKYMLLRNDFFLLIS